MPDSFQLPDDLKGKTPEEIAKLYVDTRSEYDKYKGEWEPRKGTWEKYSSIGDPEEIQKVVDWGKSIAPIHQKIAKGEAYLLNDADYKAYKAWADKTGNGTRQPTQPTTPDDDVFAPYKQSIAEELRAELNKQLQEREQKYASQLQAFQKAQQDQLNLYGHVAKLQKQYPTLDFDALLKKGADMASMPADKLLEALIESESKLTGMEAEIERRVATRIAEKQTDSEGDRVKALLDARRLGSLPTDGKRKRGDTERSVVETLGKQFPGIFDRLPLR